MDKKKEKSLLDKIRRLKKKGDSTVNLAFYYWVTGDFYLDECCDSDKAIKYYNLAAEIYIKFFNEEPNSNNRYDVIRTYERIAKAYHKNKNDDMALKYYFDLLKIYEKPIKENNELIDSNFAEIHYHIAKIYFDKNDYISAEKYYLIAIHIYREISEINKIHLILYFDCLTDIATIMFYEYDNIDKAEDYCLEAIEKCKAKVKDKYFLKVLANLYNHLAILYKEGEFKLDESEKYFLKAIKIMKSLSDENPQKYTLRLTDYYNSLGSLYYHINRLEESEKYLISAVELFKKMFEKDSDWYNNDLARVYYNLSCLYSYKNNYDLAEKSILSAVIIREHLTQENPKKYAKDLLYSYEQAEYIYSANELFEEIDKYSDKISKLNEWLESNSED